MVTFYGIEPNIYLLETHSTYSNSQFPLLKYECCEHKTDMKDYEYATNTDVPACKPPKKYMIDWLKSRL